ncbi:DNA repair protein RecN (Recombination protein N) [Desulfonauticus submarinus]|uniref:DNA repair protein RecN n=1 Tax=Desulfonauticus submarinus TaxID=206665 RepID=A0A1H0D6L3_9BACT|nr:AAA family ATPase [Desulfonauticus submarinus]SDN65820.1 DNA repair protein RecN (Recombination protein N) [Desulfonauticus submarinus]
MLEYLRIKNFSLLADQEMELSSGLNVFTGETGAGKSLLLKALTSLLGGSGQKITLRDETKKGIIEGVFIESDNEWIIRREVLSKRSRFFINDILASSAKVRELGDRLLLYVSQHGHKRLLNPKLATVLVDAFLLEDLKVKKEELCKKIDTLLKEKLKLEQKISELKEKKDFLAFQQKEIEKVNPKPGEEEELLGKVSKIKEEQKRYEKVEQLLALFNTRHFMEDFRELLDALGELAEDKDFLSYYEQAQDFFYLLQELEGKLGKYEFQPTYELDRLESRLYALANLKRKFNKSLEEIIRLKEEIEENLSFLDASKLELSKILKKEIKLKKELELVLQDLNKLREDKSRELAIKLKEELKSLGFSQGLEIYFQPYDFLLYDELKERRFKLLWQPNPGVNLEPLNKIASGGELSRFLLALMTLQGADRDTIIFDEIDTGIGGLTLLKVGEKIKQLAEKQQILLITHWPQLAVLADKHFRVEKKSKAKETIIVCKELKSKAERQQELSRMAGGGTQGDVLAQSLLSSV